MDDQVNEDYQNEIFSRGDENFDVQWAKINKQYRATNMRRTQVLLQVIMKMLQKKVSTMILGVTRLKPRPR